MPGSITDTVDKLVDVTAPAHPPIGRRGMHRIGRESLVVIDEAGLASTPKLDAAVALITKRSGRVLLVGDDRQRAAIVASGMAP